MTYMTETEAPRKLVEFDRRFRLLLDSSDRLIGHDQQPIVEIRRKLFVCNRELDDIYREHPHLLANLEWKYRHASAIGKLKTSPKRDAIHFGFPPNASDLMSFAYQENLDLFGKRKPTPYRLKALSNPADEL
jgi:hypothetical protein